MVLHGREGEQARLSALVDEARAGRAGTLLVRGEPGVGKSALLADLVARSAAEGLRVLRTQGLESESPLAYAALHRLLRPTLTLLERLPVLQARALRVAFGVEDAAPAEPFLVGVATLSLLTELAEEAPVLCAVDDAHWLDGASADALLFAARRLEADRVAVVLAARDDPASGFAPDGVDSLVLGGLDPAAVRLLLAEQAGAALADEVAERLRVETAGNPLALLELPTSLTAEQLAGTAPLPGRLLAGAEVERVFLDRLRRLGPAVQTLMLVAAADGSGQLGTVRRAAASLGVQPDAWDDAERSGLLGTRGSGVEVRHPLVRSAVYSAAGGAQRRQAHRALAEAVGDGDPDQQAWHRAAAAEGPDEEVVAALDQVAVRAERRGAHLAAAAAYERAAELSAREQARAARQYAAARNAWAAGQPGRSSALLTVAREHAEDPLLRADVDRLRGRIEVNVGSATRADRIFLEAAGAVRQADPSRALEMAVAAVLMHGYDAASGAPLDVRALLDDDRLDTSARTRCLRGLLAAMSVAEEGDWSRALTELRGALLLVDEVSDLDLLGNLGNAALTLGDDEAAHRCYATMLSSARESGAGMTVVYALQRLAFPLLLGGRWGDLRAAAEEALALARSVGQPTLAAAPLALLTLLAALQGRADHEELLAELREVDRRPLGILSGPVHDLTRWAMGCRAAYEGDTSAAFHHLCRMRLPTMTRMAVVDRIEAAVRAGEQGQAREWVAELEPYARGTGWAWATGAVEFGRAVLADPSDAPARYESALAHQARARRPYDWVRTSLGYGELLRRSQRRVDARVHLRSALDTAADLGARPLVDRAASELRASGETARRRDVSTAVALTPMELKVAQLVSRGLSNKDVAAQCWVSPRTVAFHLRNVFAKTGVASRGELAQLALA